MSDDERLAEDLLVILWRHKRQLERNGRTLSPALLWFAGRCADRVRTGQDGSWLGWLRRNTDDEHVAPKPALMTRADVAAELGMSVSTVKRLIADGALVAVEVGRSTRVRRSDLEAFLERLTRPASFRESVTEKESA